jgi:hypothetical protein
MGECERVTGGCKVSTRVSFERRRTQVRSPNSPWSMAALVGFPLACAGCATPEDKRR